MSSSANAGRGVWATWAFAALIFVGGVGVGAGVIYLRIGHALHDGVVDRDELPERMARELARDLDLSERDEQRLEKIFRRRNERMSAARDESMAAISPELDQLDAEVAELLGPEKAERWSKRWGEKRRRWAPRRSRH